VKVWCGERNGVVLGARIKTAYTKETTIRERQSKQRIV